MQRLAAPPHPRLAGAQAALWAAQGAQGREESFSRSAGAGRCAALPCSTAAGGPAAAKAAPLPRQPQPPETPPQVLRTKFSAVRGTTSANSVITMRPASSPAMEMSKNTRGLSRSAAMLPHAFRVGRPAAARVGGGAGRGGGSGSAPGGACSSAIASGQPSSALGQREPAQAHRPAFFAVPAAVAAVAGLPGTAIQRQRLSGRCDEGAGLARQAAWTAETGAAETQLRSSRRLSHCFNKKPREIQSAGSGCPSTRRPALSMPALWAALFALPRLRSRHQKLVHSICIDRRLASRPRFEPTARSRSSACSRCPAQHQRLQTPAGAAAATAQRRRAAAGAAGGRGSAPPPLPVSRGAPAPLCCSTATSRRLWARRCVPWGAMGRQQGGRGGLEAVPPGAAGPARLVPALPPAAPPRTHWPGPPAPLPLPPR